jgi:putative pyruvate formate lyase activating enzyme
MPIPFIAGFPILLTPILFSLSWIERMRQFAIPRGETLAESSYLKLYQKEALKDRLKAAYDIIQECTLCPRLCRVNRLEGVKGVCKTGLLPIISSYNAHFGEERPLVGKNGSGTIFMTHCNLLCRFCQNYDISHLGEGREVSIEVFANMMLELQAMGCHNINFVTPSHVIPQMLDALILAIEGGLKVPLVYNSGGYDSIETLRLLEGVVDIYMPDFKFTDPEVANSLCQARDYPEVVKAALVEMHRQVGDLVLCENKIAQRGLLVRHLVMPEGMAGTEEAMRFLAEEISSSTYVNIMDQYRPCGTAHENPSLNRSINQEEYAEAINAAKKMGLTRLDRRERIRVLRYF